MNEHPIENLMKTTMNSIKEMVDVNTIVGEPIETTSNMVIVPVSKVCFGFAAGGTDFYTSCMAKKKDETEMELPFGGGSGAVVDIVPVGFIIIDANNLGAPKFVPVEHTNAIDKLLDYVPDLLEKTKQMVDKFLQDKENEEGEPSNNTNNEESKDSKTIIIDVSDED